jgi:hypothetical protein
MGGYDRLRKQYNTRSAAAIRSIVAGIIANEKKVNSQELKTFNQRQAVRASNAQIGQTVSGGQKQAYEQKTSKEYQQVAKINDTISDLNAGNISANKATQVISKQGAQGAAIASSIKKEVSESNKNYLSAANKVLRDLGLSDGNINSVQELNRKLPVLVANRQEKLSRQKQRAIKRNVNLNQLVNSVSPSSNVNAALVEKAYFKKNQDNIISGLNRQASIIKRQPFSKSEQNRLLSEIAAAKRKVISVINQRPSNNNFRPITIAGETITPKSKGEELFLNNLKGYLQRKSRSDQKQQAYIDAFGLNINEGDKWYSKALKGVGRAGVGFLFLGSSAANLNDKLGVTILGLTAGAGYRKAIGREVFKGAPSRTPEVIAKSYDPRKPENWFNLLLTIFGIKGTANALMKTSIKGLGRGYVPSTRNAGAMRTAIVQRRAAVLAAKKIARSNIKAGFQKSLNKRYLSQLNKLDKQLLKAGKTVDKIIKNPKILKLEDMNPLIETSKLLKNVGKSRVVYHATGAKVNQLFGRSREAINNPKSIINRITKTALKKPRTIKAVTKTDKLIVNFIRKKKGVIGGSKAQNALVKNPLLKRASKDYDVLVSNPRSAANGLAKLLRKNYGSKVSVIKKTRSYTVKMGNKELVDFVKKPKGLKSIQAGKDRIISPEQLAAGKIKTLKDVRFYKRAVKDVDDLRRLTNSLFTKKTVIKKLQDHKNWLTVKANPKGMGKGRLAFGETHFYWDFEVPTGYAYNSIARNVFPKWFLKVAGKAGVKKSFINKLNNLKYVKSNDRFTVITLKTKISQLPPSLAKRVRLASKGRLTAKQATQLRKDVASYIRKNPNKVYAGSRTASMPKGERELVSGVGTRIVKTSKKYSIDPETGLWFDVVKAALKNAPKKTRTSLLTQIRKLSPLKSLKRRFTPGDLAKVRKYNRLLSRADKLTQEQYIDLIEIAKRLLKSKKAMARTAKKAVKRTSGVARRKSGVIVRKGVSKTKAGEVLASLKIPKRKTSKTKQKASSRRAVKPRTAVKSVRPTITLTPRKSVRTAQRASKRTTVRPVARTPSRTSSPVRSRTTSRTTERSVTRTPQRTTSRVRNIVRGRRNVRTVARPRTTERIMRSSVYQRLLRRLPVTFRVKKLSSDKKKKLVKWWRSQPAQYRPGLASIIFNITSYKIPKSITGFEIRPIIIKK